MILASDQVGGLGSFEGDEGGGGRFLSNGMTLAGIVGNWMILFGGRNLSAVTGSLSHPRPTFSITNRWAFWRKNVS